MPYGLIIYAKIKTQRASKDVPEPVGSPAVATVVKETKRNPKRRQRDVKKREQKEADEQRMFELKQQKKREKHKGH